MKNNNISQQYSHISIELDRLRPTQLTVGMLQVKAKRKQLKALKKRPSELVQFILEHPVRVVLGPAGKIYVVDHHHLALALIHENFETAPMVVEADFSHMPVLAFWKKMQAQHYLHLIDADGRKQKLTSLPKRLNLLSDDLYRSLAGFVREAGGFNKVPDLYAEFMWADFFRKRIKKKMLRHKFNKALAESLSMVSDQDASVLPGYIKPTQ